MRLSGPGMRLSTAYHQQARGLETRQEVPTLCRFTKIVRPSRRGSARSTRRRTLRSRFLFRQSYVLLLGESSRSLLKMTTSGRNGVRSKRPSSFEDGWWTVHDRRSVQLARSPTSNVLDRRNISEVIDLFCYTWDEILLPSSQF